MRIWEVTGDLDEFVKETIIDAADSSNLKTAFQDC